MSRLILLVVLLLAAPLAGAVTVHDDLGRAVSLPHPAQRIVALSPHAAEMLYAAGAGERVVGAVAHSDWPAAAAALPRVGDYQNVDVERLLSLRPDLIIAWNSGNGPRLIERLSKLGLSVYVSEPAGLESIPATLERLGRLAGSSEVAAQAAERFRRGHRDLARRYSERPPVRVFYQVWNRPLITVNGEHLISQVIRLCGGRNVFAELPSLAPAVGVEAVLAADPEAIIASGTGEGPPPWLAAWRRWPQLTAVARDQLYFVPPDLIQRHTPRILEGAQRICAQLEQARQG